MRMAKNSNAIRDDFTLVIEQDGRKMAFTSREISGIRFDGNKMHIRLKEPKYQMPYMKYLSLLREGVDEDAKREIMGMVHNGTISLV